MIGGESMSEEREIENPPLVCPICGEKYTTLERKRVGNNVYYYAVHIIGRGKDRKIVKHYLGPKKYIYVTRTHKKEGLEFEGRISQERIVQYLMTIISQLEKAKEDPTILSELGLNLDIISNLAGRLLRLTRTLKMRMKKKKLEEGR
jgi:hypothetical protein